MHCFKKRTKNQCNIILGQNFMQKVGLNILFVAKQFEWDNTRVSMVKQGYFNMKNKQQPAQTRTNKVHLLESKNEKVDLQEVATKQEYLDNSKQSC